MSVADSLPVVWGRRGERGGQSNAKVGMLRGRKGMDAPAIGLHLCGSV